MDMKEKKKKKLPTIGKVKSKLQTFVNSCIRKRDSRDGWFTCISCGLDKPVSQMQAGHYVPVSKSQYLRYNELNISGECIFCNNFSEYHLIQYRKNLIKKIGLEAVEKLEREAEEIKLYKWTREKLQEIEAYYTGLLNKNS